MIAMAAAANRLGVLWHIFMSYLVRCYYGLSGTVNGADDTDSMCVCECVCGQQRGKVWLLRTKEKVP